MASTIGNSSEPGCCCSGCGLQMAHDSDLEHHEEACLERRGQQRNGDDRGHCKEQRRGNSSHGSSEHARHSNGPSGRPILHESPTGVGGAPRAHPAEHDRMDSSIDSRRASPPPVFDARPSSRSNAALPVSDAFSRSRMHGASAQHGSDRYTGSPTLSRYGATASELGASCSYLEASPRAHQNSLSGTVAPEPFARGKPADEVPGRMLGEDLYYLDASTTSSFRSDSTRRRRTLRRRDGSEDALERERQRLELERARMNLEELQKINMDRLRSSQVFQRMSAGGDYTPRIGHDDAFVRTASNMTDLRLASEPQFRRLATTEFLPHNSGTRLARGLQPANGVEQPVNTVKDSRGEPAPQPVERLTRSATTLQLPNNSSASWKNSTSSIFTPTGTARRRGEAIRPAKAPLASAKPTPTTPLPFASPRTNTATRITPASPLLAKNESWTTTVAPQAAPVTDNGDGADRIQPELPPRTANDPLQSNHGAVERHSAPPPKVILFPGDAKKTSDHLDGSEHLFSAQQRAVTSILVDDRRGVKREDHVETDEGSVRPKALSTGRDVQNDGTETADVASSSKKGRRHLAPAGTASRTDPLSPHPTVANGHLDQRMPEGIKERSVSPMRLGRDVAQGRPEKREGDAQGHARSQSDAHLTEGAPKNSQGVRVSQSTQPVSWTSLTRPARRGTTTSGNDKPVVGGPSAAGVKSNEALDDGAETQRAEVSAGGDSAVDVGRAKPGTRPCDQPGKASSPTRSSHLPSSGLLRNLRAREGSQSMMASSMSELQSTRCRLDRQRGSLRLSVSGSVYGKSRRPRPLLDDTGASVTEEPHAADAKTKHDESRRPAPQSALARFERRAAQPVKNVNLSSSPNEPRVAVGNRSTLRRRRDVKSLGADEPVSKRAPTRAEKDTNNDTPLVVQTTTTIVAPSRQRAFQRQASVGGVQVPPSSSKSSGRAGSQQPMVRATSASSRLEGRAPWHNNDMDDLFHNSPGERKAEDNVSTTSDAKTAEKPKIDAKISRNSIDAGGKKSKEPLPAGRTQATEAEPGTATVASALPVTEEADDRSTVRAEREPSEAATNAHNRLSLSAKRPSAAATAPRGQSPLLQRPLSAASAAKPKRRLSLNEQEKGCHAQAAPQLNSPVVQRTKVLQPSKDLVRSLAPSAEVPVSSASSRHSPTPTTPQNGRTRRQASIEQSQVAVTSRTLASFCTQCGRKFVAGAKFCALCGHRREVV